MQEVSPLAVSHSKNLNFDFSLTLRNENVNLSKYSSYNFIIDVDGRVYQSAAPNEQSANICVIGGYDTYINEKSNRPPATFYISQNQRVTIYSIIRDLANFSNDSQITSGNSDKLEQAIKSLYMNYIG